MRKTAFDALGQVEAILFLVDPINGLRDRDSALLEALRNVKNTPRIGVINKADIASMAQMEDAKAFLAEAGFFEDIITISAKNGDGVEKLEQRLTRYLVEGPQYFPEDMVTDQPERIICGELIREKTLQMIREEIPHGIGVNIDKMELREDRELMDVWATIYCERAGHKGIIIGKQGTMLKRIGQAARQDMEWMLGNKVNLQLWVKVKEDWRNSVGMLRELGYE